MRTPILFMLLVMALAGPARATDLDALYSLGSLNEVSSILLQPYSSGAWFTTTAPTSTAASVSLPAGGLGREFDLFNIGSVAVQVGVNGTTPTTTGGTDMIYIPPSTSKRVQLNTPVTSLKVHATSGTGSLVVQK